MPETTPKKAKTSHATAASPAQAILSSPPVEGVRAFYYQPTAGKTIGYTPEKGHTVPLGPYEGRSHNRVGSDASRGPLLSSPGMSFFDEGSSQLTRDTFRLLAKLKNLKSRADTDYTYKERTGLLDPDHLATAKQKISGAIHLLERIKSADLIIKVNEGIAQGGLYNPYALRDVYHTNDYDITLADSGVLYHPILVPVIKPTKKRVLPEIVYNNPYDDLPPPRPIAAPVITSDPASDLNHHSPIKDATSFRV